MHTPLKAALQSAFGEAAGPAGLKQQTSALPNAFPLLIQERSLISVGKPVQDRDEG